MKYDFLESFMQFKIPVNPIRTSDELTSSVSQILSSTRPSDKVVFTSIDTLKELLDLYCVATKQNLDDNTDLSVPSDLCFNGTIPLMDVELAMNKCHHRVKIYDDYQQRIEGIGADEFGINIGFVSIDTNSGYMTLQILAHPGSNDLYLDGLSLQPSQQDKFPLYSAADDASQRRTHADKWTQAEKERFNKVLFGTGYSILSSWYGIQIALLHPLTKDIFQNPAREPVARSKPSKNRNSARRTHYIKRHVINPGDISKRLQSAKTRKCMVWYVIGHWRHLKSGKTVFVKPHWKGELRDIKMNLDDRERIDVSKDPVQQQAEFLAKLREPVSSCEASSKTRCLAKQRRGESL